MLFHNEVKSNAERLAFSDLRSSLKKERQSAQPILS
jgi:hypothetical protein